MRRIALILGLLATTAVTVAATAGADDKRSYQAELFNAFGLVEGSELRIAGVNAGTITGLDVTPQKTALVSFEVGPDFPELKADASCSSEPQSLIAEYFLDCQPGTSDQPLEAPIPAAANRTTVQNDLVQNTLREPYKRRLQLLINEFGTALVGNPENLNAAIRSGAPALRELRKVLKILGRQNSIIAGLNADADTIFARLTERREDVVRFIDNVGETAAVSAERRDDLARDFDQLDDFLERLQPVSHELGVLAQEQTPLLTDLRAAAPGLNKLAANLPRFNDGARVSLQALGRAGQVGGPALTKAQDEIEDLNRASTKAYPAADQVGKFLETLDDPVRAGEEDCNARHDLRELPGEADRRVRLLEQRLGTNLTGSRACDPTAAPGVGNPGYTGLETLLNYSRMQTLSLNLFDFVGHALSLQMIGAGPASGECGQFSGRATYPALGGGATTDPRNAAECVSLLGDRAPGVNYGTNPSGLFGNLTRYDPSVCPMGSDDTAICDPTAPPLSEAAFQNAAAPPPPAPAETGTPEEQPQEPEDVKKVLDKLKERAPGAPPPTKKKLREILGLPPGVALPQGLTDTLGLGGGGGSATSPDPIGNLFDLLLGP
jgi:phospholipid/cholesterol/gamma-HCH transport system substrate-binding protein